MSDCIFCKIVTGGIPTEFIFEDDSCVVFRDIHPKAPEHFLVVPKKHYASLVEAVSDVTLLGYLLEVGTKQAHAQSLSGFKVVINVGNEGGQVVPHLHIHFLGGKQMEE